ncbi:DNA-protecting protein DprA, partial [Sodalis-like symbiont of Bactericera trigonica]
MWLRMAAVKGVNVARAKEYLNKAADSAPLDTQALLKTVLTPRQHHRYQHCPPAELQAARRWLAQPGHQMLAITDSRYPRRLATLYCPPPALFVAGDPACLETRQLA